MATAYTSLLGLALPVTGELSGTWGNTVNTEITSLLDSAISGTTTISADADITLTTTTGAANEAREAIILWTAGGTATRNITAPAQSKTYIVINKSSSTQSIVLRGAGPTTGVTIIKGEAAVCAWNGTDFIKVSNISGAGVFSSLTVTGTTTLSGLTASTALALDASKNVVSVTNTGTGNNVLATSPTLVTPALGTPSSGVVTNLTGTASININGTVGATTANTGAFTTLTSSSDATLHGLTVGRGAGAVNTNVALGLSSLSANTTGANNVSIGAFSLLTVTTANNNVGVGVNSLRNTTGASNTGLGTNALVTNTSGTNNVAVGQEALQANTTASNNTAVGFQAGYSGTTAASIAAVGYQALYTNTTQTGGAALGYRAGYLYNPSPSTEASGSVFVGYNTGSATTTGFNNTFVGGQSGLANTTGNSNTALGGYALQANTTASNNTAVGYQAGYSNTTGLYMVAVGYQAGYSNTTGEIAAFGYQALYNNTTAFGNSAFGRYRPLYANTTGTNNTAIGDQALSSNTTASFNTAVGAGALQLSTTAASNTAVGYVAGYNITTGPYNTCVGYYAGYALTTGAGNTFVGSFQSGGTAGAGSAVTTGSKNVILGGYTGSAAPISATGSNYIVLSDGDGNVRQTIDSNGNLLVGTTSSVGRLTIVSAGSSSATKGIQLNNSSSTELLAIVSDGSFFTGTAASSPYNSTTGSAANAFITSGGQLQRSTSSLKYKTDVQDATHGLADVLQLRPVTYKGTNDGEKVFGGLIAEEVHEAGLTEFVQYAEDGTPDALAYGNMVSLLTKAIQEQQALITSLTARITALEST